MWASERSIPVRDYYRAVTKRYYGVWNFLQTIIVLPNNWLGNRVGITKLYFRIKNVSSKKINDEYF